MDKFIIDNYQPDDFPLIAKLWHNLGLGGAERGDDANVISRTLKNNGAFFVVRLNLRIIGTAWITNDQRRLYLHHMGVDEEFQNKGVGYKLLKHCVLWSKRTGLQLKLEVSSSNANAVHLYEKGGFKHLGDYDVYIIRNYDNIPDLK
jgi:ribosomal protein S18 acetylase RimI-like enzyme